MPNLQWGEEMIFKNILITVFVVVIIFFLYYAVQIIYVVQVHGSALEDNSPTWLEQLRDRAAEWNIQREINQTLELADDFEWVK